MHSDRQAPPPGRKAARSVQGSPPRDPHQIQNQWASAQPSTKPEKAWTPDPQQSGSGAGQWTNARHTTTKTASNIHAGQSLLYRQLPGGPPPAHTGPAKRREKTPHAQQLQHRRGHGNQKRLRMREHHPRAKQPGHPRAALRDPT